MLLAFALAAALQPHFDFFQFGPYDGGVPRPQAVLSYGPGERHTTYHDQDRVINAIAQGAKDRVKRIDFGASTEGRPLRVLVISSPENMKKLDEIRANNQAIADGKVAPGEIKRDAPVVLWVNECIHGNETASFESAMWLAYNLAASNNRQITDLLNSAVVVINPSYNPDGHERFVVWYNSLARGDKSGDAVEHQEPGITNGRLNHYRFDLNRDRVAMSQIETRQEVAEFRKWNPQVYVDQHGQVGTYFFPPVAQSINKEIGRDRYIEMSNLLGKDTAAAFDQHGWRYSVRETFDLYYAGYLDSWSSLNGAIGMTHETDGGSELASERDDKTVVTLEDGMAKHFTSALAVLRSAAQNKTKFLQSFAQFKQDAVQGKDLEEMHGVIVTGDERALARFRALLDDQGIKYELRNEPFTQSATSYFDSVETSRVFQGRCVTIDFQQPRGQLAMSILGPGQDFEDDFTKRQLAIRETLKDKDEYMDLDRPEFYDTTGWSVPLAFGLDAYWTKTGPGGSTSKVLAPRDYAGGSVGWLIPYTDQEDALAAIELLQAGVHVHLAVKPMNVGGEVKAGTFFVFRDRNDPDIDKKIQEVLKKHGCNPRGLATSFPTEGVVGPGSDTVVSLAKPEIAVVFGDQPNGTQFGSAWFVLEKTLGLDFTAISQRALGGDLSKYTCIIAPQGARPTEQLKQWVQKGGCLVALGNNAVINDSYIDLKQSKLKDDKDPTELPGAIFLALLNPRSPLAFGYDASKPIAVPLSGSTFYKQKEAGGAAVFFDQNPRALSGWTWPDESEALQGTVWLHDQEMGQGHVVWFAEDPTSRAMWPGTYKLLLNAVLLGR